MRAAQLILERGREGGNSVGGSASKYEDAELELEVETENKESNIWAIFVSGMLCETGAFSSRNYCL